MRTSLFLSVIILTVGGDTNLEAFMDDFMAAHPNAGGIGINWLIFGSSHHEKRPAGGVLENFTMCAERNFTANHEIKTICDPARALSMSIHNATYIRGFYTLDENGRIIDGIYSEEVHFDKIRINHYFGRSREEFIIKKNKGFASCIGSRDMSEFDLYDRNEVIDTEILSRI